MDACEFRSIWLILFVTLFVAGWFGLEAVCVLGACAPEAGRAANASPGVGAES